MYLRYYNVWPTDRDGNTILGESVYIVQDLSADLRPLVNTEWGVFDGWIMECNKCGFRCTVRTGRQDTCPACGYPSTSCITEADKIVWCEGK